MKNFAFLLVFLLSSIAATAQPEIWGGAPIGGGDNLGVLLKSSTDGTGFGVFHEFEIDQTGFPLNGKFFRGKLMKASNGKVYGMTREGGSFTALGLGLIFSYDIATSSFTPLVQLSGTSSPATGSLPNGGFTEAANGRLYGLARTGGQNDLGTLIEFRIDNESISHITSFDGDTGDKLGSNPSGTLLNVFTDELWGTAEAGGENGNGTVYKYQFSTNTIEKIYDFDQAGSNTGSTPIGNLVIVNENIYGVTASGGTNGTGTIYEISNLATTPSVSILYHFPAATVPRGGLMLASDTKMYGVVSGGTAGKIYSFVAPSTYTEVDSFDGTNDGGNPTGTLVEPDKDILFGLTETGGANGLGTLFKYTIGGVIEKIVDFDGTNGESPIDVSLSVICSQPQYTPPAPEDQQITKCEFDDLSISVTNQNADTYQWKKDGGDVAGQTTATLSISTIEPEEAGVYTLAMTNTCGTTETVGFTVVVNTANIVANASSTEICEGEEVTLSGSGGSSSSYMWDNDVINNQPFTPTETKEYTLTGTGFNGCVNTDVITVVVKPAPDVVANATSTNICSGESITLTGSGADSYEWDNQVVDGEAFVPLSTTTYTVTGTDAEGCTSTDQVTITVTFLDTSISQSSNELTVAASDATYQWIDCSDDSNISGATSQAFIPDADGQYKVEVSKDGCTQVSECVDFVIASISENTIGAALRYFPNPASDYVFVDFGTAFSNIGIRVINQLGQIVKTGDHRNTSRIEIDTRGLENGSYLIHVTADDRTAVLRMIKQ